MGLSSAISKTASDNLPVHNTPLNEIPRYRLSVPAETEYSGNRAPNRLYCISHRRLVASFEVSQSFHVLQRRLDSAPVIAQLPDAPFYRESLLPPMISENVSPNCSQRTFVLVSDSLIRSICSKRTTPRHNSVVPLFGLCPLQTVFVGQVVIYLMNGQLERASLYPPQPLRRIGRGLPVGHPSMRCPTNQCCLRLPARYGVSIVHPL